MYVIQGRYKWGRHHSREGRNKTKNTDLGWPSCWIKPMTWEGGKLRSRYPLTGFGKSLGRLKTNKN